MTNKETLNEEQIKTAQKEAGGFYFPVYMIQIKYSKEEQLAKLNSPEGIKFIFVEAERWADARAYGVRYFGVSEVDISKKEDRVLPRIQLRWAGNAAAANNLRLQHRTIVHDRVYTMHDGWKDVR